MEYFMLHTMVVRCSGGPVILCLRLKPDGFVVCVIPVSHPDLFGTPDTHTVPASPSNLKLRYKILWTDTILRKQTFKRWKN